MLVIFAYRQFSIFPFHCTEYGYNKKLPLTWWRLYEGGGFTKARAGYTPDNQHKSSGGHTPPLS